MSAAPALKPLAAAFPAVASWLDATRAPKLPRTRADDIAARFALDDFGRNLLLLGAYAALEPAAGEQIVALHGDARRTAPSVGLALSRLPGAHWSAFGATAPLRAMGIIRIDTRDGLGGAPIALAEPVLLALLDAPSLAEELAVEVRVVGPREDLSPSRRRLADAIALRLQAANRVTIQLCGPDAVGKEQAAAAAAGAKRPLFAINAAMLPGSPSDIARQAQIWHRDLLLTGGELYIDASRLSDTAPLALFAELVRRPLIVAAPDVLLLGSGPTVRLDMPRLTAKEQLPVWRDRLGSYAGKLNGTLDRLASQFAVSPELAESVAAELAVLAQPEPANAKGRKAPLPDYGGIAWDAARRFARPRMDDLARRIESEARWNDLVLPPRQKAVLDAIAAQVRNRTTVYEEWGFAHRVGGRGLGVSVLFSGPSGTGKTLAGEVLGAELGLDVYRIDLASMVSKWVGETEKNLRRVFDAAEESSAILQFDEADALFGKRGEVNDSRDRLANIEVSYLLQRLEEYRGLSILTTNFRANIDPAFLRRLRFILDFDFPGTAERTEIWKRMLPKDMPCGELDFAQLAQLNIAGGSIRNVAMVAAFLAADRGDGTGVTMNDMRAASRLEYEKLGRALTAAELRGWEE